MAAPTYTARATPNGNMLGTGRRTLVTFALDPNIELEEVSVTPSGFDGGDPRDITSNFTVRYMQKAPNDIVEITDLQMKVKFDPQYLSNILAAINRRDSVSTTWPTGDTEAAWGYLRSFQPSEHTRGSDVTADCVIVITNTDPSNCQEAGPVFAAGTGTASFC